MESIFRKQPLKMLRAMPPQQANVIREAIESLAERPNDPLNDVKTLVGRSGARLRVGKWRVIFVIEDTCLRVDRIAARGSAY